MNKYQEALDSLISYIEEQVPLLKGFAKGCSEAETLQELIDNHHDPEPIKFEDVKSGMWLWDSHMKKCEQVCSLNPETKIIRMESTNLANIALGVDERLFNDNRYYLIQFSKELV